MGAGEGRSAETVSLPVIWSDEAKAEFYKSEQWYAEIGVHLAERFVQAVGDTVRLIEESPFRFPVVYRDRRRAGVKRFPYSLFFQIEADRVLVIACFHGKRNPRRWQRRQT